MTTSSPTLTIVPAGHVIRYSTETNTSSVHSNGTLPCLVVIPTISPNSNPTSNPTISITPSPLNDHGINEQLPDTTRASKKSDESFYEAFDTTGKVVFIAISVVAGVSLAGGIIGTIVKVYNACKASSAISYTKTGGNIEL